MLNGNCIRLPIVKRERILAFARGAKPSSALALELEETGHDAAQPPRFTRSMVEKWTQTLQNWSITVSQLSIIFGERLKLNL